MPATFAAVIFIVALSGQDPPQTPLAAAYTPPPRKLELTFDNQGRVTLSAQQVTVSEILAEWGRKGGTKIQGAERLGGGVIQVPMLFEGRPELEVIEALTRSAAGVSVAPRRVGSTGASRFESIYIVATSNATASSPYPSAPFSGSSAPPVRGFPDDEIPPVTAPIVRDPNQPAPPAQQPGAKPYPNAPPSPTSSPVIVPVVPVGSPTTTPPPPGGRGGGGGTTTTTTGRGGGGGGGR